MKVINWSSEKNEQLLRERDITFEEILFWISEGGLLAVKENPSANYRNQKMIIVNVNNYAYLVPFVENKEEIFLKTIIPSRKATKEYLK